MQELDFVTGEQRVERGIDMNRDGDWLQWVAYGAIAVGALFYLSGVGAGFDGGDDEIIASGMSTQLAAVTARDDGNTAQRTLTEKFFTRVLAFSLEQQEEN